MKVSFPHDNMLGDFGAELNNVPSLKLLISYWTLILFRRLELKPDLNCISTKKLWYCRNAMFVANLLPKKTFLNKFVCEKEKKTGGYRLPSKHFMVFLGLS